MSISPPSAVPLPVENPCLLLQGVGVSPWGTHPSDHQLTNLNKM